MLPDLERFVTDHRSHGQLTPTVGLPTVDGYLLEVPCSCGVIFMRWVSPEDAAVELALE